jgi:hypothetical protein
MLRGHERAIACLSFSPDGDLLASGSNDTTILIWDVRRFRTAARRDRLPQAKDQETQWNELARPDAAKAYAASRALVGTPSETLAFIRGRLHPVVPVDARVATLIADLRGGSASARKAATQELEGLGDLARPALQEMLDCQSAPELEVVLQRILEKPRAPYSLEQLRSLRAVEVLEHIGNAQAQDMLKSLSQGARGALVTEEARSSLNRLAKQHDRTH